jgi:hypothetical protein
MSLFRFASSNSLLISRFSTAYLVGDIMAVLLWQSDVPRLHQMLSTGQRTGRAGALPRLPEKATLGLQTKEMTMLKKEDAKLAVIREWDAWSVQHTEEAKTMNGMLFFNYLQRERPDLLNFRERGDKWQDVHGWLLRARRVPE